MENDILHKFTRKLDRRSPASQFPNWYPRFVRRDRKDPKGITKRQCGILYKIDIMLLKMSCENAARIAMT